MTCSIKGVRPLLLWMSLLVAVAVAVCGSDTLPSSPPIRARMLPPAVALRVTGPREAGALLPTRAAPAREITRLRVSAGSGKPKIAYSFNPDDDLAAIRRTGFTHVLISYLQGAPDEEQRRKLDECQRHGLKVIYRMVDLVDRDRRTGGDARMRHAVMLLRDHPALAAWQTYEETNLPPEQQEAVYHKVKGWDPHHPVIIVTTNEYSEGWYRRTYSDDAQDLVMLDFYPYKRRYDGWPYIRMCVPALMAVQKRPVPIIPIIQASSSTDVPSSDDTLWPPPGGLEKQLNLWWSLGADAGVAFWLWKGSREYPFVGLADRAAPAHALPETRALLARIPDGALPLAHRPVDVRPLSRSGASPPQPPTESGRRQRSVASLRGLLQRQEIPAIRIRLPIVNNLKNSSFEIGLQQWSSYGKPAVLADEAHSGRKAARLTDPETPGPTGVVQRTDLQVPPLGNVTFSFYYRVQRETTRLQATIDTTAFPRFGAAAFVERRERLPAGGWRRGTLTATNSTGVAQRVVGVSVTSQAFTGDVLLDDLQLELGPEASHYTATQGQERTATARGSTQRAVLPLRYALPDSIQTRPGSALYPLIKVSPSRARVTDGRGRDKSMTRRAASQGWTLCGWSAPEIAPGPGEYACLATLETSRPAPVTLRLRIDSARSDQNGWSGRLEAVVAETTVTQLPIVLAPRQALFWAVTADPSGALKLHAAPAGYRLESSLGASSGTASLRARGPFHRVHLGTDARGEHPLNGLAAGGWFVSRELDPAALEHLRLSTAAHQIETAR